MLSFSHFIIEKLFDHKAREGESELVHHYSPNSFKEFGPMSHFGTHQAARDRAKNPPRSKDSQNVIYSARIKLGKVFHDNEDPGDHDALSYATHLHKQGMFSKEVHDDIQHNIKSSLKANSHLPSIDKNHIANDHLAHEIREAGYHTISYSNNTEDPGSKSYIITHPSQVRLIHKKEKAKLNLNREPNFERNER